MILYFLKSKADKSCDIWTLMWFLYMCDMNMYKEAGNSMTGLQWFALKKGPFNYQLYEHITQKKYENHTYETRYCI